MMIRIWIVCLTVALLVATVARAQQTSNYELRAVPAPGAVKIDGHLDDWDRSGEILMCYDIATLQETNSVRAYLMYDAQYLYAALHFKDTTPMLNHVDPQIEPGCGWRSDSVQMRFHTDRVVHVDGYYFTDKKQPVMQIAYIDMGVGGKDEGGVPDALSQGAEEAFAMDQDGKGYTQEMRIPWKLLRRDGQPYKAGESFRLGLECMWGDTSAAKFYAHRLTDLINSELPQREFFWTRKDAWGKVVLSSQGHLTTEKQSGAMSLTERVRKLKYSTHGSVAIAYQTPAEGYVTLVIEKSDGTRVRNLISDFPRPRGQNADYWDGLDDEGKACSPGDYRVRGLWHPEFDAKYQFAFGNPGTPQWETGNGTGAWISDYTPCSAASDGSTIYISGYYSDAGVGTAAFNLEGKKLWGVRPPSMICDPATAVDDRYLYLACGREPYFAFKHGLKSLPDDTLLLMRLDKTTGKPVAFAGEQRAFVELGSVKGMTGLPIDCYGELAEQGAYSAEVTVARVKGLAVSGGVIYVSSYFEDEVLVVSADTGKVTEHIKVPRPAGIAVNAQGQLLVVNARDKQVVKIDIKTKEILPVVMQGLDAPMGLTLDHAGNLYVGQWGRAMDVKVFTPEGKFLRRIGREGGRPAIGKFDASGMLMPWGLAMDQQDRLWVVEFDTNPRRISVWDTTGKFVRDFIDAHQYAGCDTWIDPDHPEHALVHSAQMELDWKQGTYRTLATLWRPMAHNAYFGVSSDWIHHRQITINERHLLATQLSSGAVVISEQKEDRLQPLAAVGNVGLFDVDTYRSRLGGNSGLRPMKMPKLFSDHLYWKPKLNEIIAQDLPHAVDGSFYTAYTIIGDSLNSIFSKSGPFPEITEGSALRYPTTNFVWSDRNGDGLVQDDEITFFELPGIAPTRIYSGWGMAVADDLTLFPTVTDGPLRVWDMPVSGWTSCGAPMYDAPRAKRFITEPNKDEFSNSQWIDAKGQFLSNSKPEMKMYSRDGRVLWTFPNKWVGVQGSHSAPQGERGRLVGPLYVIGSATVGDMGEIACFNGNLGQAFFMTTDGLMVGSMFRDARSAPDAPPRNPQRGQSFKNISMGAEWFGGQFFKNPRDGKLYLASETHCAGGTLIFELTGFDQIKRISPMTVRLTTENLPLAEVTQSAADSTQRTTTLNRMRVTPVIDGQGDKYIAAGLTPVKFTADDEHQASALAAYDDQNLYLFYQVKDSSPLRNQGKFGPYELFKSGDAVVFELGTQRTTNDLNPKAIAGDVRLLLTKTTEGTIAVLYRYVTPGAKNWIEITSGLGTLRVDEAAVITSAKMIAAPTSDGYTIEAAVPLAALGFNLKPGVRYRGDFGVIYSDAEGLKNTFRLHWSTRNTGLVSDSFIEAQVQPAQWGTFDVKE